MRALAACLCAGISATAAAQQLHRGVVLVVAGAAVDGQRDEVGTGLAQRALGLELGKLGSALTKVAVVAAPGEQAVLSGDRVPGKGADDGNRHGDKNYTA